ncbi:hypothetical protein ACKAV7_010693 [Fusarium commune]
MFIAFKNARSSLPRRIRPSPSLIRHASSKITNEQLEPSNELSERLRDTGLWQWTRVAGRPKAPIGDKHRANLVSQSLCGTALLLDKPNVEAVPKAGILWKDLNSILESLPHQTIRDPAAEPERNDTLLVNVNLCYCPPKNIALPHSFSKYGLVRMLVWISDDGKTTPPPRSAIRRKRSAFEADSPSNGCMKSAAMMSKSEDRYELRDEWINMESGYNCLKRHEASWIDDAQGRETIVYNNLSANQKLANKKLAGFQPPTTQPTFPRRTRSLETAFAEDEASEASYRLKCCATAKTLEEIPHPTPRRRSRIQRPSRRRKEEHTEEWLMVRDNYHLFRQKKPTLFWDRRPFEPLAARADEFYPRMPCALLDLQPKAMSKLPTPARPDFAKRLMDDYDVDPPQEDESKGTAMGGVA